MYTSQKTSYVSVREQNEPSEAQKVVSSSSTGFGTVERYLSVGTLLTTTTISTTLLVLQLKGYRGSAASTAWLADHRTETTIIVQVISHLLGLIHVQVLCSVLRASFTRTMTTRPVPIYLTHFVQAASTPRMSWSFSSMGNLGLLAVILMSLVPAAMWSGAITPISAQTSITQRVDMPSYNVGNLSNLWAGDMSTATRPGKTQQWVNEDGLFTFDVAGVKGLIQSSASDASNFESGVNIHAKLDKTGYSYLGRSYGTGGSAGLDKFGSLKDVHAYTYRQTGFKSSIKCYLNSSSEFSLSDAGGPTALYYASGNDSMGQAVWSWYYMGALTQDMIGWNAVYLNTSRLMQIQITTPAQTNEGDSWGFAPFNNMQCDIQFQPDEFDIRVNVSGKTIESTPINATNLPWPVYSDAVLDSVRVWTWALSYIDACVGGCQLGRALRLNAYQSQNATGDASYNGLTAATENFVASIVDNSLVTQLNTRMVSQAPQSTESVDVRLVVPSVVYGDLTFIGIVVAINAIVVAIFVLESARKGLWVGQPLMDISDVGAVVLAVHEGTRRSLRAEQSLLAERDKQWHADQVDGPSHLSLLHGALIAT